MFRADFVRNLALGVFSEVLNVINLFCLRYFFAWIADPTHVDWLGYAYALIIGSNSIVIGLVRNHSFDIANQIGNYIRIALLGTIF